ncbi:hypothetical protein DPMN_192211 [Dreissena polymorpha]|uniref:Uncharacterized protein n=1 Tax=Dreissena polymorpha TaxID=45954 RepID=A0A9D3XYX7_DREPO|nr:hypothetical protein DPMN_192211 [Dreissena polymorpha]
MSENLYSLLINLNARPDSCTKFLKQLLLETQISFEIGRFLETKFVQKGRVLPVEGSSLNPRLDPKSSFTSLWFFEILNYYHSSNYNVEAMSGYCVPLPQPRDSLISVHDHKTACK